MATNPVLMVERPEVGVVVLRLNRPEALNALDSLSAKSLITALETADNDDSVRCIVLTGAGRGFCVGADLKELARRQAGGAAGETPPRPPRNAAMNPLGDWNVVLRTLLSLHKPIIAAVNGLAVGGGLSLACAADIRIAARSAVFCAIFAERGLAFEAGTSYLLPRLIGLESTFRMVYTAERVSADRAAQIGLVGQVVEDEDLDAATVELATKIASLPTLQLGLARRQILLSQSIDDPTVAMMVEMHALGVAQQSHDYHEGHQAFNERRPATFLGY
ncbi:enoyl-CoA hydratase/isomerase family protein [Jatrophihabitans sp. DSM 45814]